MVYHKGLFPLFFCLIIFCEGCGGDKGGSSSATSSSDLWSISGTVRYSGSGLADVTMTLSGSQSGTTVTASDGKYRFSDLPNGTYNVTPSKPSYAFDLPSSNIAVNQTNIFGEDFTASLKPELGGSTFGNVVFH
jgi:hypothetical protein